MIYTPVLCFISIQIKIISVLRYVVDRILKKNPIVTLLELHLRFFVINKSKIKLR